MSLDVFAECIRSPDPPNGKMNCESKRYEEGSSCVLYCDPGYIPLGRTLMTCEYDTKVGDHDWNIPAVEFSCVEPVGLVIGGIAADYS